MLHRRKWLDRVIIVSAFVGSLLFGGGLAPVGATDRGGLSATPPAEAVAQSAQAESEAERLRTARRAKASYLELFGPFYTLEQNADSHLFLMNNTPDTISVEIAARNRDGEELPLGEYTIEALRHLELSLEERLQGFRQEFSSGNIRLGLLGDAETLQAWTVVESANEGTFEIPFVVPSEDQSTALTAFWGAVAEPETVELRMTNTGPTPVAVGAFLGNGEEVAKEHRVVLEPGHSGKIEVPQALAHRGGWARLRHDGEPGDMVATGLLKSSGYVGAFPFRGEQDTSIGSTFEGIPIIPVVAERRESSGGATYLAAVTLFNPSASSRQATVSLLDAQSSDVLASRAVKLDPREVSRVTLPLGGASGSRQTRPVRVRAEVSQPPLLVSGKYRAPGGQWVDLAFFSAADAHGMGTYPLPDVREYATRTTLVNLGGQPSRVVAQVYWRGGTYALGPFEVPAGGYHRIDLDEISKDSAPDVLGRTLPTQRPQGVLKWRVMDGSRSLIGRTEVGRRGADHRFGFNCFGCCWEFYTASIVPNQVSFPLGESRAFDSCITISDCAGTMGPYPVSPTSMYVPSPFVWNASVVSATAAADDLLSFETVQTETSPTCLTNTKTLTGFGTAKLCQKTYNPKGYDAGKTCQEQTGNCLDCRNCCSAIAAERICKKKNKDLVEEERLACDSGCVAVYEGNGCEQ